MKKRIPSSKARLHEQGSREISADFHRDLTDLAWLPADDVELIPEGIPDLENFRTSFEEFIQRVKDTPGVSPATEPLPNPIEQQSRDAILQRIRKHTVYAYRNAAISEELIVELVRHQNNLKFIQRRLGPLTPPEVPEILTQLNANPTIRYLRR